MISQVGTAVRDNKCSLLINALHTPCSHPLSWIIPQVGTDIRDSLNWSTLFTPLVNTPFFRKYRRWAPTSGTKCSLLINALHTPCSHPLSWIIPQVGTDIRDNKCSWLINTCLAVATPQQKKELENNYAKNEAKYVYISIYIYIFISIFLCIYIYIYMCIYISRLRSRKNISRTTTRRTKQSTFIYIYIYNIYIYIYVYMFGVNPKPSICLSISICIYIYISIILSIYIYINLFISRLRNRKGNSRTTMRRTKPSTYIYVYISISRYLSIYVYPSIYIIRYLNLKPQQKKELENNYAKNEAK